jgi:transcription initiation factor TFIID TATA-box-binding protein
VCIGFGLDETEYEPEQFPGLFYRPSNLPGVFLIFASGSVMLTGVSEPEVANTAFSEVLSRLDEMLRHTSA